MIKNVFLLAALSLCLFQSCDNDDNEPVPGYVSAETKAAFDEKYPAAKDVEWETRNDYLIVDFKQDKVEKEAWFDNSGTWYMTESGRCGYDRTPGCRDRLCDRDGTGQ